MYKKRDAERKSGFLNFVNATEAGLRQLAAACEPARSRIGDQDVLDLLYWTAGKMDGKEFMTGIDLERAGLMDAVRYDLLDGKKSTQPIYAELDNLNFYDAGSFFKSHKDKPRSKDMFGSLVILFPAPHEGGAFVLRHGGNETTFDSGAVLRDAKEPSIAYVAFLCDVEHEVLPVTAGYRISITYNLYLRDVPSQLRAPEKPYRTLPPTANTFFDALQHLLADPTFLPKGGVLGFDLSHEYPVPREYNDFTLFCDLEDRLKGPDALVLKTCRDLSLPVSIKAVYDNDYQEVEILSSRVCSFSAYDSQSGHGLWDYIQKHVGGDIISVEDPGDSPSDPVVDYPVHWVTEKTLFNRLKSEYAKYGNSAELNYLYGKMVLIVAIGPSGKRSQAKQSKRSKRSKRS